ncbi:MAG: phosphatidylserine decarboxylase [Burkholderiales bacterium]|nr:phosphatidylserine decarboxylase [Burkholderiales bacterium]
MNNYPHPVLAREAWPLLTAAILLALVVTLLAPLYSAPCWLLALFVWQANRDPVRVVPLHPNAILSPADGRVVVVEKARDQFANREALKISVLMNFFNVHSNRAPVDGKIDYVQYFAGKFVNPELDQGSSKNEHNAIVITTPSGQTVSCVQVAGWIARRILCVVKAGQVLVRGQRYGSIRFGSRVDIYLPLSAMPKVVVGDKVSATETILAEFA